MPLWVSVSWATMGELKAKVNGTQGQLSFLIYRPKGLTLWKRGSYS
jgi:hypothetical protein